MQYQSNLEKGKLLEVAAKKFVNKNKNKGPKLDKVIHEAHDRAFQKIDCLNCANCCKTTSPIFRDIDIKRISKEMRMKEQQFIQEYLIMDDESDYVLQTAPCPFLNLTDNKCSIYEFRPSACREYPHTNRKNSIQIGLLHVKNMEVCPAVVEVMEQLIG
ncbi:MAG: YkgJ family cysteine cluster protein [Bacteroidetes bacterium]|nr:YkgJ family cysteine cluster protein [Bacteroidota bacterium]